MFSKAKIIAILGILVLSILAGLLIKISLRDPQSKSEQTFVPAKLSETSTFTVKGLEKLNIPVLPIPKPNIKVSQGKPAPSTVAPFFENINKAAKAVEKSLMPDNTITQKTSIVTSEGIILSLSKVQFHFLYPDYFIAGLIDAQNLFIKEYNPAYEPILKIETDTQVRFIEEKIVATLLSTNMITKERAEQLVTTIRFTLPQLQSIDLEKQYSESFPFSKFLNTAFGGKTESPRTAPKGLFFSGLMEKLTGKLARKAQAAVCGTCSSLPLCFQEGAATPGKAGSELFYPSCYCTGCLTSLGCLSANSGQAAIYDQTTGICGVGL